MHPLPTRRTCVCFLEARYPFLGGRHDQNLVVRKGRPEPCTEIEKGGCTDSWLGFSTRGFDRSRGIFQILCKDPSFYKPSGNGKTDPVFWKEAWSKRMNSESSPRTAPSGRSAVRVRVPQNKTQDEPPTSHVPRSPCPFGPSRQSAAAAQAVRRPRLPKEHDSREGKETWNDPINHPTELLPLRGTPSKTRNSCRNDPINHPTGGFPSRLNPYNSAGVQNMRMVLSRECLTLTVEGSKKNEHFSSSVVGLQPLNHGTRKCKMLPNNNHE